MTIEIMEMLIKTHVNEGDTTEVRVKEGELEEAVEQIRADLLADCRAMIQKTLNDREER